MNVPLCDYHRGIYATRLQKLRRRFRYPGSGRKALAREAQMIARACPWCIHRDPPAPTHGQETAP